MGFSKITTLLCLFCFSCISTHHHAPVALHDTTPNSIQSRILYLAKKGSIEHSIDLYFHYIQESHNHDFELLQSIGYELLNQGIKSNNKEQMLTIYGAGIVNNANLFYILEHGINNNYHQIQLASIYFLAKMNDDRAYSLIHNALSSQFLDVKIEAAYYLAQIKDQEVIGQIESLMYKSDKKIRYVFPQLFAMCGNYRSINILKQLLSDKDTAVSVQSILNAAYYNHDNLLPQIRILSTHINIAKQEACAKALSIFNDEYSTKHLKKLSTSNADNVRLSALLALYNLGQDVLIKIEEMASHGNIFAIFSLRDIPNSKKTLKSLIKNPNINIRINAALALLHMHDPSSVPVLLEILLRNSKGLALEQIYTIGSSLHAYKALYSSYAKWQDQPYLYELSSVLNENILKKSINLDESDFLLIAQSIFNTNQYYLIPTTVELLESLKTDRAIQLLKQQQQRPGSPLIRAYCNLALFRTGEEGPYRENIQQWIKEQKDTDMIRFRPLIPHQLTKNFSHYELTPEETSRLLIESYQSLAAKQDPQGIETLLYAIRNGNKKNRYALAGLLIKATE